MTCTCHVWIYDIWISCMRQNSLALSLLQRAAVCVRETCKPPFDTSIFIQTLLSERKRAIWMGPMQCLNGAHAEDYQRPFDKNQGPIWRKTDFRGTKNPTFGTKPCSCHDRAKFSRGKLPFPPMNIGLLAVFGWLCCNKFLYRFSFLRNSGRDQVCCQCG